MPTRILDVNEIVVDDRFREDPTEDIASLIESIRKAGLLQAIVVTLVEGKPRLVCGRRRLEAHYQLQKEDIRFSKIECKVLEELSAMERRIAELEENIRRTDFKDLEKVKAVSEIHRLMGMTNPGWTMEQTANYLGFKDKGWVSVMTTVAREVTARPEGNAAKMLQSTGNKGTIKVAYKEIKRGQIAVAQSMLEKILAQKGEEQRLRGEDGVERRANEILQCGDSLELIHGIPDASVYLIHTDPPYGIDFDILEKGDTKADMYKGDSIEASTALWQILAPQLYRVAAVNSFAVVWVSFVQMNMIRQFMTEAGWECANKPFIWIKTGGPWAAYAPTRWFASAYDSALVFAKGNPVLVQQGKPDFSTFAPLAPPEKTHPLERPVPMLADLMGRFLIPGQTVFDPFAGSGSTLMAAIALRCNPIGFEKDQHFFNIAKNNVVKWLRNNP